MFEVFNLQPSFSGSLFSFIAWGKKNFIFFTQHKQVEAVNKVIKIANFVVSSQYDNWMHGFIPMEQSNDTKKTYFHDSTQIVWIPFWEIYPLPPSRCHLQSKLTSATNILNRWIIILATWANWLSFSHTTCSLFLSATSIYWKQLKLDTSKTWNTISKAWRKLKT